MTMPTRVDALIVLTLFLGADLAAQLGPDPLELMRTAKQEEYSHKRAQCRGLQDPQDLKGFERWYDCLEQLVQMGDDPLLQPNPMQATDDAQRREVGDQIKKLRRAIDERNKRLQQFEELVVAAEKARMSGSYRQAHLILADARAINPNPTDPAAQRIYALVDQDYQRWMLVQGVKWGTGVFVALGGGVAALRLLRSPRKYAFEMVQGSQPGERYPIEGDRLVVGSSANDADVVIPDLARRISRRHCELSRRRGSYYLVDVSTNGTTVNGKPLSSGKEVRLKRGDLVGLAEEVVLRFD
jgi:hypothetical protein